MLTHNPKLKLKTHFRNTFLTKKKQTLHFSMIPFSLNFFYSQNHAKNSLFKTHPHDPKLNLKPHSCNTFFNHFFNKNEYYENEYLTFMGFLYALILSQAFNQTTALKIFKNVNQYT